MGKLLAIVVAPIFILLGLHYGIRLPDIDQKTNLANPPFNHHAQSAYTFYTVHTGIKNPLSTVSLVRDGGLPRFCCPSTLLICFRKSGGGYALIRIPFLIGPTPALFSWIWIGFKCVRLCLSCGSVGAGINGYRVVSAGTWLYFYTNRAKRNIPGLALSFLSSLL